VCGSWSGIGSQFGSDLSAAFFALSAARIAVTGRPEIHLVIPVQQPICGIGADHVCSAKRRALSTSELPRLVAAARAAA